MIEKNRKTGEKGREGRQGIKKRRERQIDPAARREYHRIPLGERREGAAADFQTEGREADLGRRVTGEQQHGAQMSRLMQPRRQQPHEQHAAFVGEGDDGGDGEEVKTDIDTDAAFDVK